MNLAKALDTNALRRPDQPAVITHEIVISHKEFREIVCRRATHLAEIGVTRGDIVGINLKDNPEHLAALFALARIGAAALPMDWRWTIEEKSRLTDFFSPKLVLSEPKDLFADVHGNWQSIKIDEAWQHKVNDSDPDFTSLEEGDPPLLLALSSGTTGIPKGPLITHKQFFARFMIYFATLGFTERTKYLCATPLYFGGSRGYSMCSVFAGGAALLFPPPYEMSDLLEFADRHGATKMFLVPTLLRRILEIPPRNDDQLLMPSLDMLFSTGSILHPEERKAVMRNVCPRYLNFYGSTDGGGATALFWHDPPEVSGSVGRPVFGAEIEIADDDGCLLPPGEIGNIRYKHPGTATGYYNDPKASREAFRDGWYYPGDLGWRDEAGYLFIAGRAKDMIIRGGVNIYPAEIEYVLSQHSGIREAAVVAWPSREFGEEVAAFIILRDENVDLDDIKDWCAQQLTKYKLPREIFPVEKLPKSGVGKILKKELEDKLVPID
ncbi:MAG: Long-chain-fatty-acid--CoA ligase [Alphaproteobacteria bacterium MarineAlpha11_Bin1]|nr:MAG: Long-chain-fatty-acid--CoA ligase [Alphaproteobacteria bacterium MarineAlpha11_Bin1]|tara:strand:+ start:5597 stop:7078 length:1482 start_codon:yes stop_codon:yes gene_type:complete